MNEMIEVEGVSVNRIEYKGQPVITFRMVDELHDRPEGAARHSFNRHRAQFEEGYHFFDLPFDEWSTLTAVNNINGGPDTAVPLTDGCPDTGQRNPIKFFTQAGYLMLVKPFNDERAWKVQDCLVRSYFKAKELFEEHGENLGGFKLPGKLSFSLLAKEMKGAMAMAKTYGMTEIGARHFTNEAILGQYGLDIMASMGLDRQSFAGVEIHPPGTRMDSREFLVMLLSKKVWVLDPGDGKRVLAPVGNLVQDGLAGADVSVLQTYGMKMTAAGEVFFHPAVIKGKLLAREALTIEDIKACLLALPDARAAQLRINGSPVRGVLLPLAEPDELLPVGVSSEVLQ